jgi:transcriptional regulator with XRE-family HTH domain
MKQENIGAFIANLRKEQGWTQKEMASRLGVSDKAISKWETGKSLPDMGILIPVSELLGITVDELLSGKKRNDDVAEGNGYEPNRVIIDYATRTIKRIKKNYRLIPAALLGILVLSIVVLNGLGYSFDLNTEPENPLIVIVERNPMNSIGKADMTDEEQALSNFANGMNLGKTYLTYRLSDDKKMSSLGLYMFDGTKWSTYPIITNGESHLGLISLAVNGGTVAFGYYEADGGSFSTERPLVVYEESWAWGSGIQDQTIPISDSGTRVVAFWEAGDEGVSMIPNSIFQTEADWLARRSLLEDNACVVALYMVVE